LCEGKGFILVANRLPEAAGLNQPTHMSVFRLTSTRMNSCGSRIVYHKDQRASIN